MARREETMLLNNNAVKNNTPTGENCIYLTIKNVLAAKFFYYNELFIIKY
jgi:hypothetical protein